MVWRPKIRRLYRYFRMGHALVDVLTVVFKGSNKSNGDNGRNILTIGPFYEYGRVCVILLPDFNSN